MKEYPKVPRYDHPVVQKDWFDSNTIALEKYDGSNFRFGLYDEYFKQYCEIENASIGDFILGSSSVYKSQENVDQINSSLKFNERLEYILDKVNKDKIREIHDKYSSPIIIFAENMVKHTIEYSDNTPPLIVFDIYVPKLDDNIHISEYDYDEKFTGFIDWNNVVDISNNILNMKTARLVDDRINYSSLSRDKIGKSEFSNMRAEGYVIRNDKTQRRIKIRTEEFMEMNKKIWGSNVDDNDPEEKKIIYKYATNTRIKKQTNKILKNNSELSGHNLLNKITIEVLDDIWVEEWREFCDKCFNPYNMYVYTAERVKGTLMRPNLFDINENTENIAKNWDEEIDINTLNVEDPEDYIINLIDKEKMERICENIVEKSNKKFGNWVIEDLTYEIRSLIWYNNRQKIQRINSNIDGREINNRLYNVTVPFVKDKDHSG